MIRAIASGYSPYYGRATPAAAALGAVPALPDEALPLLGRLVLGQRGVLQLARPGRPEGRIIRGDQGHLMLRERTIP